MRARELESDSERRREEVAVLRAQLDESRAQQEEVERALAADVMSLGDQADRAVRDRQELESRAAELKAEAEGARGELAREVERHARTAEEAREAKETADTAEAEARRAKREEEEAREEARRARAALTQSGTTGEDVRRELEKLGQDYARAKADLAGAERERDTLRA